MPSAVFKSIIIDCAGPWAVKINQKKGITSFRVNLRYWYSDFILLVVNIYLFCSGIIFRQIDVQDLVELFSRICANWHQDLFTTVYPIDSTHTSRIILRALHLLVLHLSQIYWLLAVQSHTKLNILMSFIFLSAGQIYNHLFVSLWHNIW